MNGWHPSDIKAAVEKTGTNLTKLARKNGLSYAACRNALLSRHIPGEQAIALQIGVPLWELWPDRWRAPGAKGGDPERIDNRRKPEDSPK